MWEPGNERYAAVSKAADHSLNVPAADSCDGISAVASGQDYALIMYREAS